MGLSSELSCEAGSFSHHHNTHRFLQPEVLRFYFPELEPWVSHSVSLPSCSSWFIYMQMWDYPVHQPPPCCESSLPQLPISAPPTSTDECFFFNSLVIRLPYSLIFWQFWLFFVFKFVVVLWLCEEAKSISTYASVLPRSSCFCILKFPLLVDICYLIWGSPNTQDALYI